MKNGGGRYCSRSCKSRHYWASHRSKEGYIRTAAPAHPLADSTGIVYVHRATLYDRIGPGSHPCNWCSNTVTWKSHDGGKQTGVLVADHVDGNMQNNDPSNLVPSCFNCNKARLVRARKPQTNAVLDGELFIVDKQGWRHRAERRYCEVCGKGFLALIRPSNTRRFCSRACSGIAKRKPKA